MGNCLRAQSSMQWGGDDWSTTLAEQFVSSSAEHALQEKEKNMEENSFLGDDSSSLMSSSSTSTTIEVKIKITKKQLEELLSRVDVKKELSGQQVLAQLMNASSDPDEIHSRSWRPNLRSIPE